MCLIQLLYYITAQEKSQGVWKYFYNLTIADLQTYLTLPIFREKSPALCAGDLCVMIPAEGLRVQEQISGSRAHPWRSYLYRDGSSLN